MGATRMDWNLLILARLGAVDAAEETLELAGEPSAAPAPAAPAAVWRDASELVLPTLCALGPSAPLPCAAGDDSRLSARGDPPPPLCRCSNGGGGGGGGRGGVAAAAGGAPTLRLGCDPALSEMVAGAAGGGSPPSLAVAVALLRFHSGEEGSELARPLLPLATVRSGPLGLGCVAASPCGEGGGDPPPSGEAALAAATAVSGRLADGLLA